MPDKEKVIKKLESLRDICNAKSNMAIGNGKVAWAGYANTVDDAIALLKEQPEIVRYKEDVIKELEKAKCETEKAGLNGIIFSNEAIEAILATLKEQETRGKNRFPYSLGSNEQWT